MTLANVDPATGAAAPEGPAPVLYVQGARQPTVGIFALGISNPVAPDGPRAVHALLRPRHVDRPRLGRSRRGVPAPATTPATSSSPGPAATSASSTGPRRRAPSVIAQRRSMPSSATRTRAGSRGDGSFLFSMDELDEQQTGRQQPRARLRRVRLEASCSPPGSGTEPTPAIEHNGYTVGDRYFLSHYERGLTVLDVSHPLAPDRGGLLRHVPRERHAPTTTAPGASTRTCRAERSPLSNIDGAAGLFVCAKADRVSATTRETRSALLPRPAPNAPRR